MVGMSLIDKLGRKTLLLIGAAGCASCLAGVAWVFATESHRGDLLWLLVTFIAFFSVSQGAVIWVYIGEVFPTAVRSKGQGVGSASHWFSDTRDCARVSRCGDDDEHGHAVHFLRGDYGGAVCCGGALLSRNQGPNP